MPVTLGMHATGVSLPVFVWGNMKYERGEQQTYRFYLVYCSPLFYYAWHSWQMVGKERYERNLSD
jgi:hypothetical protein